MSRRGSLKPVMTWRRAIAEAELTATTKHVGLTLSLHMSEIGDSCFPSIDTLAAETSRSKGSILEAIRALELGGFILVDRPKKTGRGHKSSYVAVIPRTVLSAARSQSASPSPATLNGDEPETVPPPDRFPETVLSAPTNGTDSPEERSGERTGGRTAEDEELRNPPAVPPSTGDSFDHFWSTYPRRAGKRAARAAFERALKRAPASTIIAGAERYRDDPNLEPSFTAHPSTWLNQDRWEDEPLPPRAGTRDRAAEILRDAVREGRGEVADDPRTGESPRGLGAGSVPKATLAG